jgi:DnaK suppressor protein
MNVGGGSSSAREALAAERAEALDAERTETRERLAGLEREFAGIVEAADSANTDDEHDPEGATIAFERQHVAALIGQARDQLAAIDEALRRLDEGGYGQCERCGQPIAPERLAARPTATRCVSCAGKR